MKLTTTLAAVAAGALLALAPALGAAADEIAPAPAIVIAVETPEQIQTTDPLPADDYTAPVLNCEPGTVPGWLNEHGDPTSCVGDLPCPPVPFGEPCPGDPAPEVAPAPQPPADAVTPPVAPVAPAEPVVAAEVAPAPAEAPLAADVAAPMLAETGANTALPLGVAGIVLAVGAALVALSARARRRTITEEA